LQLGFKEYYLPLQRYETKSVHIFTFRGNTYGAAFNSGDASSPSASDMFHSREMPR
jgi:hypothetical protein